MAAALVTSAQVLGACNRRAMVSSNLRMCSSSAPLSALWRGKAAVSRLGGDVHGWERKSEKATIASLGRQAHYSKLVGTHSYFDGHSHHGRSGQCAPGPLCAGRRKKRHAQVCASCCTRLMLPRGAICVQQERPRHKCHVRYLSCKLPKEVRGCNLYKCRRIHTVTEPSDHCERICPRETVKSQFRRRMCDLEG
jgi:hypothetical protein